MITALLVEETSPPWDAEFEEGARSPVSTLCSLSPPSSALGEAVVLAKTPSETSEVSYPEREHGEGIMDEM